METSRHDRVLKYVHEFIYLYCFPRSIYLELDKQQKVDGWLDQPIEKITNFSTFLYVVTGRSPATDGTSLCFGPSAPQRYTGWSWCPHAYGHDRGGTVQTRAHCDIIILRTTELLVQQNRPSFTVLPPTCNVLMQDLMSLSVFSHSDIRVAVSAFIPCRSEICKQKPL